MSGARLIVLTGPAAAGKSTLAVELQAELARSGELWLILQLDGFGRGIPRDWIAVGSHRGAHAERGFVYERSEDRSLQLRLGPDGRTVLAAFHRSVAAVVRSGVRVICETVVYDEEDRHDWSAALGDIAVRWIGVTAPLETLEAREATRARHFQGLARGMFVRARAVKHDLEVDTGSEPADAIARRILGSIRR